MAHGDGFPLLFQFFKFIVLLFTSMFVFQGAYFIFVTIYYFSREDDRFKFSNSTSVDIIVDDDGEIDDELVLVYEIIAFLTNLLIIALT